MKGVGRLSPFFIITARPSFLQFHLMLIRRNTGIAWMRFQFHLCFAFRVQGRTPALQGSLLCASEQFTGLFGFTQYGRIRQNNPPDCFSEHRFCFAHPNNLLDCCDLRSILVPFYFLSFPRKRESGKHIRHYS